MAKFPWGESPAPFSVVPIFALTMSLLTGIVLAYAGPDGEVPENAFPTPKKLHYVVVETALYFFVYYIFMGTQVGTMPSVIKMQKDVLAASGRVAERCVYNTLEQMCPFLVSLWMHALFVNPRTSYILGFIYVAFRAFYPIFYGLYGQFNLSVEICTQTNYSIVGYFLVATVIKCVSGGADFHSAMHKVSPFLVPLGVVGGNAIVVSALAVLGGPVAKIIIGGVQWEKGYGGKLTDKS